MNTVSATPWHYWFALFPSLLSSETYSTWNQTIATLAGILLNTQRKNISDSASDNTGVTLLFTATERQELALLKPTGLHNGFSI